MLLNKIYHRPFPSPAMAPTCALPRSGCKNNAFFEIMTHGLWIGASFIWLFNGLAVFTKFATIILV